MLDAKQVYSKDANGNLLTYALKNGRHDLADDVLSNTNNINVSMALSEVLQKYPDGDKKREHIADLIKTHALAHEDCAVIEKYLTSPSDSIDTKATVINAAVANGMDVSLEFVVRNILPVAGNENTLSILDAYCSKKLVDDDVFRILNFACTCKDSKTAVGALDCLKRGNQYVLVPSKTVIAKLCAAINAFLSSFFLVAILLLMADSMESATLIIIAAVIALIVSIISVKIYNYSFIIMAAFSGAFIASIGGCGIIYNADASRVFLNLMLGDDVAGFILIGTLVLGVLGCIVQWRRLKGKTANGANTGHKTTVSENTAGAFAPAEKASIQNPFVREIKENWGLLLVPIVVTLFWNLWGSRLLWTLFPSMYNYDFLPQTLWHYMPSIITAILSGWEMATFIVAIKTRSKNFCILWMLPNMIIALVYLVKMFRLLTTYGGLAWIFDLAYVIACFVPFLSWWIIRKLEKAFAAFSRNDIKAYVLGSISR